MRFIRRRIIRGLLGIGCLFAMLGPALPALANESEPWGGALRVALVSPTGNAPIGKPSSVQLSVTRPSKEVTIIFVRVSTFDADLVPATPVNTGKDGEYIIGVSSLPIGAPSAIPFTLTLHGGEGGGARVLVADNLGGVGEDLLHFGTVSPDYGGPAGVNGTSLGLAYAVPAAGQVLAPQIQSFQKASKWAQSQVATTITLPAPLPQDIMRTPIRTGFNGAHGAWNDAKMRATSEALHYAWDQDRATLTPGGLNPIPIVGRLVFQDDFGCESPAWARQVTWRECHLFKNSMAREGNPITADAWAGDIYRPLPATIEIAYIARYPESGHFRCDTTAVQLNADGTFRTELMPCERPGAADYTVEVSAFLDYQVVGPEGDTGPTSGYVRSYWQNMDMRSLFPLTDNEVANWNEWTRPATATSPAVQYSTPAVVTRWTGARPPAAVSLGTVAVAAGSSSDYNYLRAVLSAHTTMVQLHRNLQALVPADSYRAMFGDAHESGQPRTYALYFDNTWAFGWGGGVALLRPDPDPTHFNRRLLSQTDTLAHEFGHSIHGSLAGSSFYLDYRFANLMMRPDGSVYDWGHGPGQYQEMGVAFTEGMASAFGQYLLNSCGNAMNAIRGVGGADPFFTNMWNADDRGDTAMPDVGSNIGHFRYQVRGQRGIVEGSPEWRRRLASQLSLTSRAAAGGHRLVTSNNEARYAEFGCDLMDHDSRIDYVSALAPVQYLDDFVGWVWYTMSDTFLAAMGGTMTPYVAPRSETVEAPLSAVVQAMATFCPGCRTMSGDQSAEAYMRDRLSSTSALQAPWRLALSLSRAGYGTVEQMRDVLRANFMETRGLDGAD